MTALLVDFLRLLDQVGAVFGFATDDRAVLLLVTDDVVIPRHALAQVDRWATVIAVLLERAHAVDATAEPGDMPAAKARVLAREAERGYLLPQAAGRVLPVVWRRSGATRIGSRREWIAREGAKPRRPHERATGRGRS